MEYLYTIKDFKIVMHKILQENNERFVVKKLSYKLIVDKSTMKVDNNLYFTDLKDAEEELMWQLEKQIKENKAKIGALEQQNKDFDIRIREIQERNNFDMF